MHPSPQKTWVVSSSAPPEFLAAFPELPNLIAHLLYHRGVRTQEDVDAFLNPDYGDDLHDPFLFRHMGRAVDRLLAARDRGERVVVYGDYDADGVSGATVLADTLEALGATVEVFLPHRERDGYGLNAVALDAIAANGAKVVVTCDCGIANVREVGRARDAGIDVIITDHHLVGPELPPAYAILHPKVEGETYPYRELTGGGVAFTLCRGLVARDRASAAPRLPDGFEKWLLDCVAISTVADYGPLVGENRVLVTYGLVVLAKTRRPGLRALYEVAGINPARITPATIGFQIAPRINAAGRIDHANEALKLLRCRDDGEARTLAEHLNATNTERQRLVEIASAEAIAQVGDVGDRRVLVVVGKDWAPGIVGLVATRVRERFFRPTLALTHLDGHIMGSGRSTEWLHIVEALRSVSDLLAAFGGHPQACGLTLKDGVDPAVFAERMDAYAVAHMTPEQLTPKLAIDWELPLEDVSWELVEILGKLGPFGVGNPTPRYVATGVTIDDVKQMGATGKHCRLLTHHRTSQQKKMVVFGFQDICPNIRVGDVVDVVFEVDVNEWNGNREIQLKVVDMRPADARATTLDAR